MPGYWTVEESNKLHEMRLGLETCISAALPKNGIPEGFRRYRLVLRAHGILWIEAVFSKGTPRETALGFSDALRGIAEKVVPFGISAVRSVVLIT